jgi:ligand-binding sensor domain-containing protein
MEGLYEASPDGFRKVLAADEEDGISNAIQCLWGSVAGVWAGAARGINYHDGQDWRSTQAGPQATCLTDIRSIAESPAEERLYFASFRGGPSFLEDGDFVSGCMFEEPLTGLAASTDGSLWAATMDSLYRYVPGEPVWKPVDPPVTHHLGDRIIQCLGSQPSGDPDGMPVIWVGTSAGLLRYRPAVKLWDGPDQWAEPSIAEKLGELSIQTLFFDAQSGRLWVGSSAGLFGSNPWKYYPGEDVRAIGPAFPKSGEALPDPPLWLGTSKGLLYGSQRFTTSNSGLAADLVTALFVRTTGGDQEVWAGAPGGLSVYRI